MDHLEKDILFSGKVFSLYSQVALFDAEIKDSYPQWKAGDELVVFGSHGVAVVTAGDQQVDVLVCKGKIDSRHALCISGEIFVGNQGVLVGNVPASAVTNIPIVSGKYSVVVYTDGIGPQTKHVYFLVNRLSSDRYVSRNSAMC
jgi:hypothetical protein